MSTEAPSTETFYSTQRAYAALLAMAGMALQWACLHCVTFASTIFPLGQQSAAAIWPINTFVTFSVFIVIFLHSPRLGALSGNHKMTIATLFCLIGGFLLFSIACLTLPTQIALAAASALMACGTTPLIVMWGEMFKFLDPKGEQLFVTLGGIVCSVALYLVETLLPTPLAVILFIIMPIASLTCLHKVQQALRELSDTWVSRAKMPEGKSPALFYICIAAFSIPCNYLRDNPDVLSVIQDPMLWKEVLAVTVVIMVVVTLSEILAERQNILLVPSFVLFMLLSAMLVHLLPEDGGKAIAPYLLYSGYYLFLAMIYLALGPFAACTSINPTRLFCGAMIANVGGLLAGTVLGKVGEILGNTGTTVIVLGVTGVILLAGIALYNNRSYSIFRINYFDEDEYSFEYVVPLVPANSQTALQRVREADSMLDAISARCNAIGGQYSLSAREHDVLCELVRGRTISTIAKQLGVSENTVKAHTKAIYRKLDVHTREELLSRVEQG